MEQSSKVAGNNAMDATVLEITKDGVRVQRIQVCLLIVRAEHTVLFASDFGMNTFRLTALAGLLAL